MKINLKNVYSQFEADLLDTIHQADTAIQLEKLSILFQEEQPMQHYRELEKSEYQEQFINLVHIISLFDDEQSCMNAIQQYDPYFKNFEEVMIQLKKLKLFIPQNKVDELTQLHPVIMEAI